MIALAVRRLILALPILTSTPANGFLTPHAGFVSTLSYRSPTLCHTRQLSLYTSVDNTEASSTEASNEEPASEESKGEKAQRVEEPSDILNSPAFLQRKVEVLKSDAAALDKSIEEANAVYLANKEEWRCVWIQLPQWIQVVRVYLFDTLPFLSNSVFFNNLPLLVI